MYLQLQATKKHLTQEGFDPEPTHKLSILTSELMSNLLQDYKLTLPKQQLTT
jgi:hypothetical protein